MIVLVLKVERAIDQKCNASTCADLLSVPVALDWSAFLVLIPGFSQQTSDSFHRCSLQRSFPDFFSSCFGESSPQGVRLMQCRKVAQPTLFGPGTIWPSLLCLCACLHFLIFEFLISTSLSCFTLFPCILDVLLSSCFMII